MIKIYTGTPGAGKSLHAIKKILAYLADDKNVISNFPIKYKELKPKFRSGKYFYVPNEEITVDYLYQFNNIYHKNDKESQTLLIIDEASVKFNCRTSMDKDRLKFLTFFAQHRKFGFDIILVSQNMKQIDRQIRDLIELEIIHRKLNNYSFYRILPFSLFVAIERNVVLKQKNEHEFFMYDKYSGSLYDTFYDFTRLEKFKDQNNLINEINKSCLYDSKSYKFNITRSPLMAFWGSVSGALNSHKGKPVSLKKEDSIFQDINEVSFFDDEMDDVYVSS